MSRRRHVPERWEGERKFLFANHIKRDVRLHAKIGAQGVNSH